MKYIILYKETKIGVLEINNEGKYKYTPEEAGIDAIKNTVSLNHEMLQKSDWRDPIPFFKERIDNASRFSKTEIAYHTDFFRMVKE